MSIRCRSSSGVGFWVVLWGAWYLRWGATPKARALLPPHLLWPLSHNSLRTLHPLSKTKWLPQAPFLKPTFFIFTYPLQALQYPFFSPYLYGLFLPHPSVSLFCSVLSPAPSVWNDATAIGHGSSIDCMYSHSEAKGCFDKYLHFKQTSFDIHHYGINSP